MPWYLCSNEDGLHECTTWSEARRLTHGRSGSWVKKYARRTELLRALSSTRHVPPSEPAAADGPVAFVDGSCVLGQWSACAVFFSAGDEANEVLELAPPHTAPRAELAAVLLLLRKGFDRGRVFSDSSFVCRAFARGWPETYAHQDLMEEIRRRWPPGLSVHKVQAHAGQPGNEAVDAMLRERRTAPPASLRREGQPVTALPLPAELPPVPVPSGT